MSKVKSTTKLCKYCKTEIPADAKICPNCRKKQSGKTKWIIGAIVILGLLGAAAGGGSDDSTESVVTETSAEAETTVSETTAQETTAIEYIEISPDELLTAYEENEVKGDEIYKDKMMRLTGIVGDIGKDILDEVYVTFETSNPYSITSVQCYFDDDSEIQKVMELKPGDTLTVSGRCDGKFANVFIKECHIE